MNAPLSRTLHRLDGSAMIAVLSPAKSLDETSPMPAVDATEPRFAEDAAKLAAAAAKLSSRAIGKLMHISPTLATLNAGRFKDYHPAATDARPALFTFDGDVYAGLRGPAMDAPTRRFAQAHVRILSGLYGVLRPLDRIQPYRLEMGTKLKVGRKHDLYSWWGERLGRALANDLVGHADDTLVNLASKEYFDAVAVAALPGRVLVIDFRDRTADGAMRFNTFVAKRARGAMARFLCEHRLHRPEGLKEFAEFGYAYDAALSNDDRWAFVRDA